MTDDTPERNFHRMGGAGRGRASWACLLIFVVACCAPVTRVSAQALTLLVQPPMWAGSRFDARAFARRLAQVLDRPVTLKQSEDALSHWREVLGGRGFALALNEAPFAAYLLAHHGFSVLAQAGPEVRFAVVVRPRTLITAPSDLSALRVAVPPPPALAALRLMNLYPDPVHAPELVPMTDRDQALQALAGARVSAVVMTMSDAEGLQGVRIALETDASPGRAFSVAAQIAPDQRRKLLDLFRGLGASEDGRRALAGIGAVRLDVASGSAYEDAQLLLKGTWGYSGQ